ncbi:Uu.00g093340.m01.CDS01 [Anthostomella pinea]|uniref:Uu.00g093340.m01.CDS01 n=1 Tax=Anthostomella pinea TaxID=933095 RepID=A0AAI8YKP2_9PEZI|nr:Uu.00g093340.m01.CDS01 [Anthostomella pinea]
MGFSPNGISDILASKDAKQNPTMPMARVEARDEICVAAMSMKYYYDRKHLPRFYNAGDRVLLRLHKGYVIPKAASVGRKLGQRYAGPFKITERIGRSAYRLEIPQAWRIHDVISVDHLEPVAFDVFGRYLPYAGPIRVKDHQRAIVDCRISQTRTGEFRRWLVSYEGLGPEYDEWLTANQLGDQAEALINSFQSKSQKS